MTSARLTPVAWRPVGSIAAIVTVILLALSPWYGYHRDELYFRMLGEQPALGYVDTPPLTPMIARVSTALFGDHVGALRVVPALCMGLLVVLGALIARELGGDRTAQILASVAMACAPFPMTAGHTLFTLTADLALWSAAILFLLRALLREDGRWWLAAGAAVGVATYNRQLIALLLIGLAVGLLAVGPRRRLADPWLWAGVLVAGAFAVPNIVYQATHDWPQFTMAEALERTDGTESRILFLPLQLLMLSPIVLPVIVAGVIRLWRERRTRAFVIAYLVAAAFVLYSGGRADYVAGFLVLFLAAGCPALAHWMAEQATRRRTVASLAVVNAIFTAFFALPLLPASTLPYSPAGSIEDVAIESVGWPEFAAQVARVHNALPAEVRANTVLLTSNYGEAGALARWAEEYRLPAVYSGHNELWFRGPPPESARFVVAVGPPERMLNMRFADCVVAGHIDNSAGVDNEERGEPILVCGSPVAPWRAVWPRYQHYS